MKTKYIMVDTWNGSGYSSENGTEIKIFSYKAVANKHAKRRAKCQSNDIEIFEGSIYSFEIDEDYGSYQVHELKEDAYAVMIRCNDNYAEVLTELEFKQAIEQLKEEFLELQKQTGEDEEDYFDYQPGGDIFVSAWDDYDFQFRILKI